LRGFPGGVGATRSGMLETPCDILIRAVLERQITEQNAGRLDCGLIVEAASGPITLRPT
jgi:glutamate dehydrogenase (NAD(P)+)